MKELSLLLCAWGMICASRLAMADESATSVDRGASTQQFAIAAAAYDIQLQSGDGKMIPLKLRPDAVLKRTNPVRVAESGAVFVWLAGNRPEVIASLFTYEGSGGVQTRHEIHSLSLA